MRLELPDSAGHRASAGQPLRLAPSAARNIGPILDALAAHAPLAGRALEIASGTGQQVVRFAALRPELDWQPTDLLPENLAAIEAWRHAAGARNIRPPRPLDAGQPGWGATGPFALVLAVNLLHLIPAATMAVLLVEAGRALGPGGRLMLYGPFLRDGRATSPGDAAFDARLRAQDPRLGYKDVAAVEVAVAGAGLRPVARLAMPANNLFLIAERTA